MRRIFMETSQSALICAFSILQSECRSPRTGSDRRSQARHAQPPFERANAAIGGGDRCAKEIALDFVAALAAEYLELGLRLDPLGHNVEVQAVSEGDDRRGDLGAAAVGAEAA